jgi:hypothetical protein
VHETISRITPAVRALSSRAHARVPIAGLTERVALEHHIPFLFLRSEIYRPDRFYYRERQSALRRWRNNFRKFPEALGSDRRSISRGNASDRAAESRARIYNAQKNHHVNSAAEKEKIVTSPLPFVLNFSRAIVEYYGATRVAHLLDCAAAKQGKAP